MHDSSKPTTRTAIYLYMFGTLVAAALYALMSALIKLTSSTGDVAAVITSRYAFSCIALLPLYLASGRPTIKTTKFGLHLIRGILSFTIFVLYTLALQYIPLQNAMVLNSSYVLFLPLLSYLLTRAAVSLGTTVGLLVGFVGVVIVVGAPSNGYLDVGSLLALASALATAGATAMVARLRSSESSFSIVFYFFSISFGLSLFWFFSSGASIPRNDIWLMTLVGVTGVAYQYLFTMALKHISSELASSIMNLSIIFGFVLEYILFQGIPTTRDVYGTLLILVGITVVIWSTRDSR